jgi:uncharacterized protein (TIGR03086 family)
MRTFDLGPAARNLGRLVRAVPDDDLARPTPCPDYSVGDLLDHVGGLAFAFTAAARKTNAADDGPPPPGDASRLDADWRTRIPDALDDLAAAWRDPDAWGGMTAAGGVEMPGEVAALVALDELVIHGWDLARATSTPFSVDDASLAAVHDFVAQFSTSAPADAGNGLFGPAVPVPDDAPLLDRVVGMAGRDPAWSPA